MAGNTLGPTARYIYTSDNGTDYVVRIPVVYGLMGALGFGAATPGLPVKPKRMKMRFIWVQDPASGARKKVPCANITATGYTFAVSSITINTVAFDIMSRHGEKAPG